MCSWGVPHSALQNRLLQLAIDSYVYTAGKRDILWPPVTQSLPIGEEIQVSSTTVYSQTHRPLLQGRLLLADGPHTLAILIDSCADAGIISGGSATGLVKFCLIIQCQHASSMVTS